MKEAIDQTANATRSNQVGVEWSQASREVNHRHNLTAKRLAQLEEHVHVNDLASSTTTSVPETIGAVRELHSKVHTLKVRLQKVRSDMDSSPREAHMPSPRASD